MNNELQFIEAISRLETGYKWDWVYISFREENEVDGVTYPNKVHMAFYLNYEVVLRVEAYEPNVPNVVRRAYQALLNKNDARRVIKAKNSSTYFSEWRAFRNGYKIPSHIWTRGVEFPFEGV